MSFLNIIGIELQKIKRSKIVLIISLPSLIVIISGLANIGMYITDNPSNAWSAMFVQSTLMFAYYMMPFSIIILCVLISQTEYQNKGIIKMLSLPIDTKKLSFAKYCVIVILIAVQILLYFVFFTVGGIITSSLVGINIIIPIGYLLSWCVKLFLAALPMSAVLWATATCFKKIITSLSIGMALVLPSIFVSNTRFWFIYPFNYPGILISDEMFKLAGSTRAPMQLIPFIPVAIFICIIAVTISTIQFGKIETN
ncbi:ABC transporter permease subunit [Clostridium sp. P21]|uniref:ABC transporter permease subunit n=1 Tax=Clostridium muellerianum TaxID=2716538 RepID=A0A7Y0EID3_9CLOT|nr:ABC transporter permease [Clostridium muellerianum]NMM64013.1 ABC transporter permease subunit [Clostridium muellerianum]